MPARESRAGEVLPRVRAAARPRLRRVRGGAPRDREVLPGVRPPRRRRGSGRGRPGASRRRPPTRRGTSPSGSSPRGARWKASASPSPCSSATSSAPPRSPSGSGRRGCTPSSTRFFETALAEVHRYEGTVNQFLGDGFMALFGAPLAHEDHARRAALAALGVAPRAPRAPRRRRPGDRDPADRPDGPPHRLRGRGRDRRQPAHGLHGGRRHDPPGGPPPAAGRAGRDPRERGDVARSSRATSAASAWGPLQVRGRSEPVVVVRLLGVGAAPLAARGPRTPSGLSHFVGRDRELEALLDLFAAVEEGRGQAVGIVGEPGVGKSRLLLEFRHAPRRAAASRTSRAGASPTGRPSRTCPVVDIVRANCGLAETDPPEAIAREGALRRSRRSGLDPDAEAPYLLRLLGGEGRERTGSRPSAPRSIKARTFETLRQMCLRGSRRRPLVLEVEDLHWVDRTSEEYLAFLAESLVGAPDPADRHLSPRLPAALERSVVRDPALAPAAGGGREPLDRPVASCPPRRRRTRSPQLILDKAEGNPFFLEELARAVGDQGLGAGLTGPGHRARRPHRAHRPARRGAEARPPDGLGPRAGVRPAPPRGRSGTIRARSSRTSASSRGWSSSSSARPARRSCTPSSTR